MVRMHRLLVKMRGDASRGVDFKMRFDIRLYGRHMGNGGSPRRNYHGREERYHPHTG